MAVRVMRNWTEHDSNIRLPGLAQELGAAIERKEAWRMTLSFGLMLPEKMWKVEGVALSDSRGIPTGPYAGPSDPPVAPQNPTWGPRTPDEGPWAERHPSSTWLRLGSSCRDMGELARALHSAGSTFASLTLQASAQPAPLLTPVLSIPPTYNASSPPGLGQWALPQLPLFVLFLLNLGVQGRNSLLALLQHGMLPGKRQGSRHVF